MSYGSAPFWWLICDAPGCRVKSTEGSDYAAWAEQDGACEDARDSGWAVQDDPRHYCQEHEPFVCQDCGQFDPAESPREREYLCLECWKKAAML